MWYVNVSVMSNSHYNVAKPVTFVKANTAYASVNRRGVIDFHEITVPSTFSLFEIFLSNQPKEE